MSRERTRPLRSETRQQLFVAAAKVFTAEGIVGASVEDICLEAGLTRGALYSNFGNKDELVMAMLDEHVDQTIAEMERLIAQSSSVAEYLRVLESSERRRPGPFGDNSLLHVEFMLYALRNPKYRVRLRKRQERIRKMTLKILQLDVDQMGHDFPLSIEQVADFIVALDTGYMLAELIEPGSYKQGAFSNTLLALRTLWHPE